MNGRQFWIVVVVLSAIAVTTAYFVKKKNESATADTASQSQLPAQEDQANYTVPPDIGASVDNTGGLNFPVGENGITYTLSQANSLPSTGQSGS